MNKQAKDYNSQGLELFNAGRLEAALNFFTKAIDEDPEYLEAYKNRGKTLIKLNRVAEGEKDLQKAEGQKKKPDTPIMKEKKAVKKYNLHEVEDLWSTLGDESTESDDDLFLDDFLHGDSGHDDAFDSAQDLEAGGGQLEDDSLLYDDTFSEFGLEDEPVADIPDEQIEPDIPGDDEPHPAGDIEEENIAEETEPVPTEPDFCSARLEYTGGMHQEVTHARLFAPMENSLLIIDEETNDEQVVFFDQLTYLRVSNLPAGFSDKRKESSSKEIIETVDGKTYHEFVPAGQELDDFLICFSEDDETPFPFTLFQKSFIKKRTLDKPLTDILFEKRFISKIILKRALQEFEQLKGMTLEKIIAQKAQIRLEEVEEALEQNAMPGLQKEEILLISGLVNEDSILEAVDHLEHLQKMSIEQFLIEKGIVKEQEVYISLAEKHRVPFIDLAGRKFSKTSLTSLPRSLVETHQILPLAMKDDILLVATHLVDPEHLSDAIIQAAGCQQVKYVMSPPSQLKKIIRLLFTQRKQ